MQRTFPFVAVLVTVLLVTAGLEGRAAAVEKYKITSEDYAVPDVTLINQDGEKIRLKTLLNAKKVAMVDFIFTTCTTICPVLSAGFANFQRKMGPGSEHVQLISISIDPEHDTPKRLREYLKRYNAKPGWQFLTGTRKDVEKVVRALDAYTPDKMSHLPLALLYSSADKGWVRIYGLVGTSDLIGEYEKVLKR